VVEPPVRPLVLNLFALVREALARAMWALSNSDVELGRSVVDGDQEIDELTSELELLIRSHVETDELDRHNLRELIGTLVLRRIWNGARTSQNTSRNEPSPTWGRR